MKKYPIGFVCCFVLLCVWGLRPALAEKNYGDIFNAEFVRAVEADVVIFNLSGLHPLIGEQIPVRLRGIDVPQINTGCVKEREAAVKARKIVSWLLTKSRTITLKKVGRDNRFRITAVVLADNRDIREILLQKGLATRKSTRQKRRDWCQ